MDMDKNLPITVPYLIQTARVEDGKTEAAGQAYQAEGAENTRARAAGGAGGAGA